MKNFNPSSKQSARAVQAWQILVGKAKNRQTVTYLGSVTTDVPEKGGRGPQ